MSALIAFLTSTAAKWVGMALAVIVPLFVAWRAALGQGAAKEKAKQASREAEAVKTSNQVDATVGQLSASATKERLKAEWQKH